MNVNYFLITFGWHYIINMFKISFGFQKPLPRDIIYIAYGRHFSFHIIFLLSVYNFSSRLWKDSFCTSFIPSRSVPLSFPFCLRIFLVPQQSNLMTCMYNIKCEMVDACKNASRTNEGWGSHWINVLVSFHSGRLHWRTPSLLGGHS